MEPKANLKRFYVKKKTVKSAIMRMSSELYPWRLSFNH